MKLKQNQEHPQMLADAETGAHVAFCRFESHAAEIAKVINSIVKPAATVPAEREIQLIKYATNRLFPILDYTPETAVRHARRQWAKAFMYLEQSGKHASQKALFKIENEEIA